MLALEDARCWGTGISINFAMDTPPMIPLVAIENDTRKIGDT
jgi:hypothetical protein